MDHLRSKRRMRRSRHAANTGIHGGRSPTPSPSANDLRGRKTERSPAIGKASVEWWKEQLRCDLGGAAFPFSHADQSAEQSNGSGVRQTLEAIRQALARACRRGALGA